MMASFNCLSKLVLRNLSRTTPYSFRPSLQSSINHSHIPIKLKASMVQQERSIVEASDQAQAAQAEVDREDSRASEREADLKDRIRFLEERLVLLTEPDTALLAEYKEEAQVESETAKLASSPCPDADSPEAVAARCVNLLVEVRLI